MPNYYYICALGAKSDCNNYPTKKHMGRFIECCCTSVNEVLEAVAGGASRIELCEELKTGGITPSRILLEKVLEVCPIPVNVLVRPRDGDFVFNEEETEQMIESIETCKKLNVNGVVIGALKRDGYIDKKTMNRLMAAARPLSVTFHRAFDCCSDPYMALEDIISLGCDRLLTSGLAVSAYEGRELISKLVSIAGDRIVIMPGAGIKPSNINEINRITRAAEYHGSAHSEHGSTDRRVVSQLVDDSLQLL